MKEISGAIFDGTGKYRYDLWRIWDHKKLSICWILLNPTNADEIQLDPISNKCKYYTEYWGYGGFHIVNAFGLITKSPKALMKSRDPVGRANDYHIFKESVLVDKIIVGWGNYILKIPDRLEELDDKLYLNRLWFLKLTNLNQPASPLGLRKDVHCRILKEPKQSLLEVCKYVTR